MVMMNSFSRSAERPNNFRAIFFIKDKVSDAAYREMHKYLQGILKDRGYISATKAQKACQTAWKNGQGIRENSVENCPP